MIDVRRANLATSDAECILRSVGSNLEPLTAISREVGAAGLSLLCVMLAASAVSAQDDQESEPFYMFNALWFREDGGAQKYSEYLQAAGPFVSKHGGQVNDTYAPEQALIGEFDADLVFFVEWPNQEAFTSLFQDPGYQAIAHLREEAIVNSLLIRFRKLP
ncbi:MAG TPA: DUF1330 domain-containing protein [Gemmatimonadetes bacterium]|nr:DUF1330 domain-containing protein [Gemmatimonadota bacterium]